MVTINTSLDLAQKSCVREDIDEIEHTVTARLDHLEQAIRELLQIVSLHAKILLSDTKIT
jgi:hypothetical protein